MQKKLETSRPELIAFVGKSEVIPFENVLACHGDIYNGTKRITVYMNLKDVSFGVIGVEAIRFLNEYSNYLAFIEAATITDLTGVES